MKTSSVCGGEEWRQVSWNYLIVKINSFIICLVKEIPASLRLFRCDGINKNGEGSLFHEQSFGLNIVVKLREALAFRHRSNWVQLVSKVENAAQVGLSTN